jgi:hypothetical protein
MVIGVGFEGNETKNEEGERKSIDLIEWGFERTQTKTKKKKRLNKKRE